MSYAFGIAEDGRLRHLYWGPALRYTESLLPVAQASLVPFVPFKGVDASAEGYAELPTRESGDYGDPVLWVRHSDGVRGLRLIYESHAIDHNHLMVITRDAVYPVTVEMHYRLWDDLPLLSKWLVIRNGEEGTLELEQMKSAAWSLPAGWDYRLTHLSGNWGCEYTKNQLMLTQARTVLQNSRVTCSAAQQTPFFALDKDGTATETDGQVYFGVLHWSGDFDITVERQFGRRLKEIAARKPDRASYLLTVTDTGIGMSAEFLQTVFDPFARENTSTVSGIQGTGLGMAIVKRFIDLMGGDNSVQSEPGKGTRLDITLDFRIDDSRQAETKKTEEILPVSFKGLKVLLVEDNEMNREIAFDILSEEGLLVETAENGSLAVDMMKEKGPDYFDFILIDIQMPVMNGYEATRAIRSMYPDRHIPIIALTANAFAEDKMKSREAGMDDHVAKPINVKELFASLAKNL